MLPAAIGAPFTAVLADRFARQRVMVVADLLRAASSRRARPSRSSRRRASPSSSTGWSSFVSLVATAFRPAQAGAPALARAHAGRADGRERHVEHRRERRGLRGPGHRRRARRRDERRGRVRGHGRHVSLVGAAPERDPRRAGRRTRTASEEAIPAAILGGFRPSLREGGLRLLVALFVAQTLVYGALSVLLVVVALELLDLGESGLGYLYSALGVGGVAGRAPERRRWSAGGASQPRSGSPSSPGAPDGAHRRVAGGGCALVLLGLVGAANTVVDVAGLTLLQRAVPDEVLGAGVRRPRDARPRARRARRRRSLRSSSRRSGPAVRSSSRAHSSRSRPRSRGQRLRSLDDAAAVPTAELELLRAQPLFAPLPGPVLENLAGRPRAGLGRRRVRWSCGRARRATGSTSSPRASSR